MIDGGRIIASAKALRLWLERLRVQTLYIEPASPWENGSCESFNSKLRDEFLSVELFATLKEAQTLAEWWRQHFKAIRLHSSLGYRPPAPQTVLPTALKPPYGMRLAA